MATSDSPLNVPDVTLAVARGAGQPPPEPGAAPSISSFSGTFAQGNTMTLSGSFTAERDGMLAYLQGDPALAGSVPSEIVDFNGNPTSDYEHATDQAFGKSGASFKAMWPDVGNVQRGNIRLPNRSKKLFFSFEVLMDLSGWEADPEGAAPQLKFARLLGTSGTHNDNPSLRLQMSGRDSPGLSINGPLSSYQGRLETSTTNNLYFSTSPDRTGWFRFIIYAEIPSSKSASDGRQFVHAIRHSDNQIFHVNREFADGELGVNPDRSFLAPAVHSYLFDTDGPETWINAMMPFYKLNIDDLIVWFDLIGVNDTPERVELGNNPIMDDCTKLVLQKQTSRTYSTISFEVEEGNFEASDDIYAFVVNGDTQYTGGILIREGA